MNITAEIRLEETFTSVKDPFYGKSVRKNVYAKEVDFEKMVNPNLPKQGFVLVPVIEISVGSEIVNMFVAVQL